MTKLQSATSSWCAIMVAALAVVQFTSARHPPLFLFFLFAGVWAFGAIMIHAKPMFGAVGTAAYGAILGVDVLLMHGFGALDVVIAVGSFIGAALAIAVLVQLRKAAPA